MTTTNRDRIWCRLDLAHEVTRSATWCRTRSLRQAQLLCSYRCSGKEGASALFAKLDGSGDLDLAQAQRRAAIAVAEHWPLI